MMECLYIRDKLRKILNNDNESFEDLFPCQWLGESPYLSNPVRVEMVQPLVTNLDFSSHVNEIESFKRILNKSFLKCKGETRFHCHVFEKNMGIASSFAAEFFGHRNSFYTGMAEALDAFSSIDFVQPLHLSNPTTVLIVGDSSNILTAAIHSLTSKLQINMSWNAVIRNPAFEGVMRNLEKVNDIFDYYMSSAIIKCDLVDDYFIYEVDKILNRFNKEVGYSTLIADATGEQAFEALENEDHDGTKWLFLSRYLILDKLLAGGSAIIRLHIRPLTNINFCKLLIDIYKRFSKHQWILPTTGRDTGIIYLAMYNFKQTISRDSTLDMWPLLENNIHQSFAHERIISDVLAKSVPSYVSFMESVFQMMHCDEEMLAKMQQELLHRRASLFTTLELTLNRILDKEYINGIVEAASPMSLIYNFHNPPKPQFESMLSKENIFPKKSDTNMGLYIDIHQPKKFDYSQRDQFVSILQYLRVQCVKALDITIPRSLSMPQAVLDLAKWSTLPSYCSAVDVVMHSRWCINGIVFIRGILKSFLMPHTEQVIARRSYEDCRKCYNDEFFKFCQRMHDQEGFKECNKQNTKVECFGEAFKEFASKTDRDLAYERATKMLDILAEMKPGENLFACAIPLLTRLDMSTIYLAATMFQETKLITSMNPKLIYGVLFRNRNKVTNLANVRDHVNACITLRRNEFVDEISLTEYFATSFVYTSNVFCTNHFLKAALRNTLNINKKVDARFID